MPKQRTTVPPQAGSPKRRRKPDPKVNVDATVFVVRDGGALDLDIEPEALPRLEVYCLSAGDFEDPGALIDAAGSIQPLMWELTSAYEECRAALVEVPGAEGDAAAREREQAFTSRKRMQALEELPPDPELEDLAQFVQSLSKAGFKALRTRMTAWATELADPQSEEDYFIDPVADGQETVLRFFRDELDQEKLNHLGVRIVEGQHPGSLYYAAELTIDPAEATRRAAAAGIPARFVRASEEHGLRK